MSDTLTYKTVPEHSNAVPGRRRTDQTRSTPVTSMRSRDPRQAVSCTDIKRAKSTKTERAPSVERAKKNLVSRLGERA